MREFGAELMKVRTRWLPYVVLLALIGGAAMQVLLFGVVAYHAEQDEFGPSPPGLRSFAMPWAFHTILDSGQFWGVVLIAFIIASVVATEHGWGTVRIAVARGQGRVRYLAIKLVAVTLISTLLLLTALAAGVAMALVASYLENRPLVADVPGGPSGVDVPVMILRAAVAILPYGMLAFALAVAGRSTAFGAAGLLAYKVGEMIMLPILDSLGGSWEKLQVLFIGHYADSLIAANRIGPLEYNSMALRDPAGRGELPDPWAAAIVMLMFTVAFATLAFASFGARDLNARAD